MTEPSYAVGIDLGTTHCALSYVDLDLSEGEEVAQHVLVDGAVVVRDGRLFNGDIDAIRQEAQEAAQRLWAVPLDGCRCEPCGTTQPSLETKEPQARNGYEEKNGEIKKNSFSELQRATEKIYITPTKTTTPAIPQPEAKTSFPNLKKPI